MSPDDASRAQVPERPRARDEIVFRELADEWILYDPDTRQLHVLNLCAALVWSHCTGSLAAEEIVERVRDAFDDPPEVDEVERDVREALSSFAREGLLA